MGSSPMRPKIGFQFRMEVSAGKGQAALERKVELAVVSFVQFGEQERGGLLSLIYGLGEDK